MNRRLFLKYAASGLFVPFLPSIVRAFPSTDFNFFQAGTPPVALSCQLYVEKTATVNGIYGVSQYNGRQYQGLIFDDTNAGKICKVDALINDYRGDPTLYDFYFETWPLDGSRNFIGTSPSARSDKVDGTTWSSQWVSWAFTDQSAFNWGTYSEYAIVLKMITSGDPADTVGTYDSANGISWRYDNASNGMSGCVGKANWDASGAFSALTVDNGFLIKLYTMQ